MILGAGDILDWIADREIDLVQAWAPELGPRVQLEAPFAECLAAEFHALMLKCLIGNGTGVDFLKLAARNPIGVDPATERAIGERFYSVTLKLARAACRHVRYSRTTIALPFLRAVTARDDRVAEGHRAIDGIVLPVDHRFWRAWCPPLDMDCRCSVIQMLRRDVVRYPVTDAAELAWREARLDAAWPPAFAPLLDFRR